MLIPEMTVLFVKQRFLIEMERQPVCISVFIYIFSSVLLIVVHLCFKACHKDRKILVNMLFVNLYIYIYII